MSRKEKELYEFGQFRLDVTEHFLARLSGGECLQLSEKAFATLCVLVRGGGHLIRKDELMNQVWADSFVEENNLDKCIYAIRRALGEKPGEQKFIETVRKHGYRFVAQVRRIEEEVTPAYRESAIHAGLKQIPGQNFPPRVEQTETPKTGAVVALADWRRKADENEASEQEISPSPAPGESTGQITELESDSVKPDSDSSAVKTKTINFPQISKRRKGLLRGLKFLLCGLGVGFVFLVLMQVLLILVLILFQSENALLLGASKQLAGMISNLLGLIQIPIGLGFFVGIGLFLFGCARIVYALFEKEDSKINPTLVERIIVAVIIVILLSVAVPNLIHSYREANRTRQPQQISN